jgi:hypothetical protein
MRGAARLTEACNRLAAGRISILVGAAFGAFHTGVKKVDNGIVVPVALFLCITLGITYIARLLVNARLRVKMLQACTSKELVEAVVQSDSHRDQMTALRWGILTVTEAIAFGIIQAMGWTDINPGVVAMLLGAFGLGSLLFFVLARRFR